ncbi:phage antirepressor KilAC domain-containing protein [Castellaniella sp.]|uniref:phage antirepressor KilAC domain-containing protein n=1 Tax=Castellaniella sp. TaxID=1955812 RepID=UPI002AFEA3E9|nr:phage antirepressor KilAC domain-containing protein [Castellaniella sp.]
MTSYDIAPPELSFNGIAVRDNGEMLSLTDMWRAAGSPSGRAPNDWRMLTSTAEFCDFVAASGNAGKSGNELFQVVRGGKEPGTWAHWQIALAYAKYLSPEFHMQCNVVIRERMEGKDRPTVDPTVALNNPATLRQLLLDNVEKVLELEGRVEEMRPQVQALERIAVSDGSMCITDAAKTLQVRPKDLFSFLRSHGWIYRRTGSDHDVAYQPKLASGLLEHKTTTVYRSDGSEKVTTQVRVTPKGLARLAREFPPIVEAA